MIIEVKLFDEQLGTIEWNDNSGSSTFQYSSNAFFNGIEPSPILMPKRAQICHM